MQIVIVINNNYVGFFFGKKSMDLRPLYLQKGGCTPGNKLWNGDPRVSFGFSTTFHTQMLLNSIRNSFVVGETRIFRLESDVRLTSLFNNFFKTLESIFTLSSTVLCSYWVQSEPSAVILLSHSLLSSSTKDSILV